LSGFLNCETGDFSILMRDIDFSHCTSNSLWCLWILFPGYGHLLLCCSFLGVGSISWRNTSRTLPTFVSRCFSLHANAFLLVIFSPCKPTNCNSTAIVPTGFLKFSLISVQAMFVDFGLAKETGGGCYLRWVNGVVWFWSIILLCFLWLSSTSMTANCHSCISLPGCCGLEQIWWYQSRGREAGIHWPHSEHSFMDGMEAFQGAT